MNILTKPWLWSCVAAALAYALILGLTRISG